MKKTFEKLYWLLPLLGLILKFTTTIEWKFIFFPILFFLLIPDVVKFFKAKKNIKSKKENFNKEKYKAYYKTSALMFLNPIINWQSIIQLLGQLFLYLFDKRIEETKNKYIFPFNGKWDAVNGGTTQENSHSWDIITQRFAYDFVIIDAQEKSFKEEPNRIENYYCYNQPILASQKGVVIDIRNNVRDYQKVGDYSVDWKTRHIAGNYITIKHDNEEFSFYAHLKRNSMKVKKGDVVKEGQYIANCGNSGNSTEPHLHFQLMNRRNFFFGKSLKIKFENAITQTRKEVEFIEKEMIVKNKKNCNQQELKRH